MTPPTSTGSSGDSTSLTCTAAGLLLYQTWSPSSNTAVQLKATHCCTPRATARNKRTSLTCTECQQCCGSAAPVLDTLPPACVKLSGENLVEPPPHDDLRFSICMALLVPN
jgi:hypothetical protein